MATTRPNKLAKGLYTHYGFTLRFRPKTEYSAYSASRWGGPHWQVETTETATAHGFGWPWKPGKDAEGKSIAFIWEKTLGLAVKYAEHWRHKFDERTKPSLSTGTQQIGA